MQQVKEQQAKKVNSIQEEIKNQPGLPDKINQVINGVLDKCELCHKRPKAVVKGETKKACSRCMDVYYRAKKTKPGGLIKKISETLGHYADADLADVPEPYQNQIREADGDIYLFGPVGVGKTYAISALIKDRILHGFNCERITFDSFCSSVRSTWCNNSKTTEDQLVSQMADVDCLFIDDIGLRTKQETDFAYITLYRILDQRQTKCLPTYITTNKGLDQLASSFDGRIASRLSTATIIEMKGQDRRLTGIR